MKWHQLETDEVLRECNTRLEGLTPTEVEGRQKQYGPNRLPETEDVSKLRLLLHQFTSPLIYILLVAAIVTALLKEYIDTGVIVAVVILNAIVGFFQEYKAETSVRALRNMVVARARVVRDGKETEIPTEELVPGDIVVLASGAKVPADLRLTDATELRIEEATLTGESVPVEKTVHAIAEEHLTAGDQTNMAFMGTAVVNGRARGIVVETGAKTILGGIARDVQELSVTETPLQKKIVKFAQFIGLLVLGSATAIIVLGFFLGMTLSELFTTAVAASVATVPEGLPIVVTVTMAIGISRMVKRNAIIRKLPAVETLGSTTIICSDKTGTLTKNEMTVKAVYDGYHAYEVTGSGYDPEGEILHDWEPTDMESLEGLHSLLRIGLLCNESRIIKENDSIRIDGDPTEGALIVSATKAGFDHEKEKGMYPQIGMIPFESDRGFMATLHRHNGKAIVFLKGAPERVLDMCSRLSSGEVLDRTGIIETAERFAEDGLRVLAMAFKEVAASEAPARLTHDYLGNDLVFAGLQGMIDPPRPEAIEAIQGCKDAGIRVAMITGDHAITASAIGKMMGLAASKTPAITGKELEEMTDDELFHRVQETSVYARVSPQHKLRIVQQYMKHGEVVAVTGDGVNDAPALKAAHIGAAMGKSGTDVAREAADMIITDDNFASIFHAVEEGRIVFDNIRKVTLFLIPTGFAAILSILISMILDIPIPYVAAQLLWINLVTNGLQDVALAFEPGEKGIIKRKPRNPKEGIMSRLMLERSVIVGILIAAGVIYNFHNALSDGASLEHARTIAMTTMVLFQFFQAWNSRSETRSVFLTNPLSNPFLFYSMIAAFFAQIAVIYVPALQWVFRTNALTVGEWGKIAFVALTVVAAVEVDKYIRTHKKSNLT
ncbi:MAG: HAD-IC family P-type ATPase [Syntrophorhabdaceae bacterium]|nr:HAD-IC family P-type ATPase [Syntrophorhabdaceae bacterium]MDD5244919.1 HAD-IC family P-type ATPase [Syntrophorhabdaceae bacterium]